MTSPRENEPSGTAATTSRLQRPISRPKLEVPENFFDSSDEDENMPFEPGGRRQVSTPGCRQRGGPTAMSDQKHRSTLHRKPPQSSFLSARKPLFPRDPPVRRPLPILDTTEEVDESVCDKNDKFNQINDSIVVHRKHGAVAKQLASILPPMESDGCPASAVPQSEQQRSITRPVLEVPANFFDSSDEEEQGERKADVVGSGEIVKRPPIEPSSSSSSTSCPTDSGFATGVLPSVKLPASHESEKKTVLREQNFVTEEQSPNKMVGCSRLNDHVEGSKSPAAGGCDRQVEPVVDLVNAGAASTPGCRQRDGSDKCPAPTLQPTAMSDQKHRSTLHRKPPQSSFLSARKPLFPRDPPVRRPLPILDTTEEVDESVCDKNDKFNQINDSIVVHRKHGAAAKQLANVLPASEPKPQLGCSEQFKSSAVKQPPPSLKSSTGTSPAKTGSVLPSIFVNNQQYLLWSRLGKGANGVVHEVLHINSGTTCALKVVTLTDQPNEVVLSCKKEVALLRRLQSPSSEHVIRLMDFEATPEKLFIVMEKADTDLRTFFERKYAEMQSRTQRLDQSINCPELMSAAGLDYADIKFFWRHMLSAVHYLHKHSVVHADLKPANFVFCQGIIKLIDFGISSRLRSANTEVAATGFTINYASPEALGADQPGQPRVGFKSDVWSLTCILYQMVYSKTPYQDLKTANLKEKIDSIRNLPVTFSPLPTGQQSLLDTLRLGLHKNPTNRPTTQQLLKHPYLTG